MLQKPWCASKFDINQMVLSANTLFGHWTLIFLHLKTHFDRVHWSSSWRKRWNVEEINKGNLVNYRLIVSRKCYTQSNKRLLNINVQTLDFRSFIIKDEPLSDFSSRELQVIRFFLFLRHAWSVFNWLVSSGYIIKYNWVYYNEHLWSVF